MWKGVIRNVTLEKIIYRSNLGDTTEATILEPWKYLEEKGLALIGAAIVG
jgi:hypothetical protein